MEPRIIAALVISILAASIPLFVYLHLTRERRAARAAWKRRRRQNRKSKRWA
jgi:hypothetical protein